MNRLLSVAEIPSSLWVPRDDLIVLPAVLVSNYRTILEQKGLNELALQPEDEGSPVGGVSEEQTRTHFARRFAASCARVQLTFLDPRDELHNASDLLIKAFSGGRVGLLDIPCGAGAAFATLLSMIAELRSVSILPRLPLEVFVVGGDKSQFATVYAGEFLDRIRAELRRQAIKLHFQSVFWDVLDEQSTTNLLYAWMELARDCREHFIVIANFSAFLQSENKLDQAQSQIKEIFRWARSRRSKVIWIEPQTNVAKKNFFPRLFKRIVSLFRDWVLHTNEESSAPFVTSQAVFQHPLKSDRVRVQVCLLGLEVKE